jgi:FkbM family methyltransferase
VIDIGANVGMFACRVAGSARRIICYEPSLANFSRLARNTRGRDGIVCVREAVAAAPGTVRLYRPGDEGQSYGFTLYPDSGIGGEYHDVQPEDSRTRIAHFASRLESKGFAMQTKPSKRRRYQSLFFARRR